MLVLFIHHQAISNLSNSIKNVFLFCVQQRFPVLREKMVVFQLHMLALPPPSILCVWGGGGRRGGSTNLSKYSLLDTSNKKIYAKLSYLNETIFLLGLCQRSYHTLVLCVLQTVSHCPRMVKQAAVPLSCQRI